MGSTTATIRARIRTFYYKAAGSHSFTYAPLTMFRHFPVSYLIKNILKLKVPIPTFEKMTKLILLTNLLMLR